MEITEDRVIEFEGTSVAVIKYNEWGRGRMEGKN
jgi:hypothetical protein